jgi:hemerythrin-like domain-containing protein
MDSATRNLENDHIYILKLIDVMRAVTGNENPDVVHIADIIDLIRNFADGLHHAKEENLFFPMLETKGFSSQQGPVAVMLREHIQGRNFVREISVNLELYKKGDNTAIERIYQNMRGYADLLVNHIMKENNILFRMADSALSADEQKNMLVKFKALEHDRPAGSNPGDYVNRINILASYYKVL